MPWWGWVIVGVVAWFAFLYTLLFILSITVFNAAKKEIKKARKGW